MMNFLLLSMAVSLVIGSPKPASIFRESSSLSGSSAPYDKKAAMLKELEDAQLLKVGTSLFVIVYVVLSFRSWKF